jgi:hypothetical protein
MMRMKNTLTKIFLLLFVLIVISCGSQNKLTKSYQGKPVSVLAEQFGKPKTVFDQGEEKVYIYEETEELRSTEIAQGKLTLDPMVSPMVKKTKRMYFTVKDGKIIKVKLEEEYER